MEGENKEERRNEWILLSLGLVMNKNGGAKGTTPDLLHELVLIHPRLHFCLPSPQKLKGQRYLSLFFSLNKRVESTCLLLFNVIVAKSYLTYTLPLPPMIHTSDPDILFRFSRLYQDNCKSFQIHMRKGFDKEEEWKLSLSLLCVWVHLHSTNLDGVEWIRVGFWICEIRRRFSNLFFFFPFVNRWAVKVINQLIFFLSTINQQIYLNKKTN